MFSTPMLRYLRIQNVWLQFALVVTLRVSRIKPLMIVVLLSVLSACDGGLFGTGDGSDVVELDAGAPGVQTPPATAPETPDVENPGPPDNTGAGDDITTINFDNLINGAIDETPLVTLLNTTDRSLNITRELDNASVFAQAIDPGMFSEPATLLAGDNFLDVIDVQSALPVFSIRPLNAGTSSVTTLIARRLNDETIDIIALRTITISNTPSVAQVRVVQANLLDVADTPATLTLQPAGLNPGDSEVTFPDVSASSASQANYQPVSAGTFELIDPLTRFNPIALTFQADEIYTLVIIDNESPVLIVLTDTDLLDPP